jgi:hypothetical protein
MPNRLTTSAILAAAVLAAAPAAAVNLVENGSFETGTFAGWGLIGDILETIVTPLPFGVPTDGIFHAAFLGDETTELFQTLATTPGATYLLTFDLANNGPSNFVAVLWGGLPVIANLNLDAFDYTPFSRTVTATGPATELSFLFRTDTLWLLDNVRVSRIPVSPIPEPATWALLVAGFGLIGCALRNRRGPIGLAARHRRAIA